MIRQKTTVLSCVRVTVMNDGIRAYMSFPIEEIQVLINNESDKLLEEINSDDALAFIDLKITHMWSDKHQERIAITIFYRETPKRKVLIEKTND